MDPDLLATIDLDIDIDGVRQAQPRELKLYEAIPRRRTDRHGFGPEPVSEDVAAQLVSAAGAQGARLHLVNRDHIGKLAVAAARGRGTADGWEPPSGLERRRRRPHGDRGDGSRAQH